MKDFQDKVAFVTGGASGIGLGMAKAFAGAGMRVVTGWGCLHAVSLAPQRRMGQQRPLVCQHDV